MATDAEARAAGFTTPAGTDLISGGDNAIRQNARTALDLINDARFSKATTMPGGDLDTLTAPGAYPFWSGAENTPAGLSGTVYVTQLHTTAGAVAQTMQLAFSPSTAGSRLDIRFTGPAGWSAWNRLDAGAIDLSDLGGGASGSSPTAFKTVPVALTVGGGIQNYPATKGGVRIPVNFSVPIKRWRMHLRNINPRQGEPGAGNVAISSVYIGRHGGNGTVSGGNTLVGGAMSSGSGSDMVTPWSSTEISSAYEYLISFGWTASQQPKQVVGGGYTTATVDDAFSNAATATRSVNLPLDAWIEAEVEADVPVIAGFGDSLTSGVGAVLPVFNSWLTAYCRTHKALPVHYSASGDTMAGWSNGDHYKWTRWDRLTRPDAVVHAMGSNDVFGGASLATMQDRFRHTVDLLAEKVSPVVYAATIMPREGSAWDAMEQGRRDYNAWLAGRTRDLFDFVGAVSLDDETLIDSIDADGIHLTTAGYQAVAGAITGTLTSPHTYSERLELGTTVFKLNPAGGFEHHAGGSRRWLVDGTGKLLEGAVPSARVSGLEARLAALEYTSGRRNITSLIPGVVSGDLFALRNGPLVSLEFSALKLTPQAGSFIDLGNVITDGFRISGDREYLDLPQPVTGSAAGPIRLRRVGALLIYGANNGEEIYGTVTYQTLNPPPANPPGSPA